MFRALLAADGNTPRVQRQAEAIASLPNAATYVEAIILHVFEDSVIDDSSEMVDPRRVTAVSEAAEYLTNCGIDVELLGRGGQTVQTILGVADEYDVDRIYVGGPARSPAGKAVFGSVAQQVIIQSSVPVTVTIDQ